MTIRNSVFIVYNFNLICFQLFKTEKRGWGIRCLNDIAEGQFICVYTGTVLTEQRADEEGKKYGDEYFADLDLIEVVENFKLDYESNVEDVPSNSGKMYGNKRHPKLNNYRFLFHRRRRQWNSGCFPSVKKKPSAYTSKK